MCENEIEGDVEIQKEKPRFALVELSQLENLLQHCFEYGKAPAGYITELIPSEEVKVCSRWKKEKFEVIAECPHITEQTHPDSNHEPISPESKWYKVLLASVSKTACAIECCI
jgi:hypothetical protein